MILLHINRQLIIIGRKTIDCHIVSQFYMSRTIGQSGAAHIGLQRDRKPAQRRIVPRMGFPSRPVFLPLLHLPCPYQYDVAIIQALDDGGPTFKSCDFAFGLHNILGIFFPIILAFRYELHFQLLTLFIALDARNAYDNGFHGIPTFLFLFQCYYYITSRGKRK